ncbi:hypothetical protein GCM10009745_61230 [Kribbella yunnanensis]|uniref:Htaa domain-containing protein n=1 Tax=Kribbella yunnanensis TaxID=190194 RepID=A0ABP4UKI6_9ACTN
MRKYAVLATSAVLLTAGLATPAWAAAEAPTDVRLAWDDGKIRVTWNDDGSANSIRAVYPRTGASVIIGGRIEGETNELVFSPGKLTIDEDQVQITVASGTSSSWGTPTASASFDTRRPVSPDVYDAELLADRSVRVRWRPTVGADKTPGDPLDRPAAEDWFEARVEKRYGGDPLGTYPVAAGVTSVTVPAQSQLTTVDILTGNGWGQLYPTGRAVYAGTLRAGIAVPAQGTFSERLKIESTLVGTSENTEFPVQLQARATSSAAWKTVGRYTANTQVPFDTGIASLGGRQYRLWVPALKKIGRGAIQLVPAGSTSAKSSQTMTRFAVAGFTRSTVQVGVTVNLSVKIQPGLTVRGTLQRWANGAWRTGPAVQIKNGTALVPFKAAGRGTTTRYRVTVPKLSYNGLPLAPSVSKTFTLTVR